MGWKKRKNARENSEVLDFEKLLFGESEEEKPKSSYKRWLILLPALAALALTVGLWPKPQIPEGPETPEITNSTSPQEADGEIYGVLAPEMISWRVNDTFYSGLDYSKYVWFTASLDPQQWGVDQIDFHITADAGQFIYTSYSSSMLATYMKNGETAIWVGQSVVDDDALVRGDDVYVEFIARSGQHIVGFALAQILPATENQHLTQYTVRILGTTAYPLVDGQFQQITEDHVRQQIEALKEEMK